MKKVAAEEIDVLNVRVRVRRILTYDYRVINKVFRPGVGQLRLGTVKREKSFSKTEYFSYFFHRRTKKKFTPKLTSSPIAVHSSSAQK